MRAGPRQTYGKRKHSSPQAKKGNSFIIDFFEKYISRDIKYANARKGKTLKYFRILKPKIAVTHNGVKICL